jgi:MFS transporter, AAHS family, 4-hydroxybenzoate transporter
LVGRYDNDAAMTRWKVLGSAEDAWTAYDWEDIMNQLTVVAERLIDEHPIGRRQFILFAAAIFVLIVDGFDLQIISYLIPAIADEWPVTTQTKGLILSAGLTGLMFGYLSLPLIAVRIGLKRMVILSLLAMSATSFLTLLAGSAEQLIILRFLTGLTLGGVFPNMVALATEYCPERYRASLVSISYVGLPLGFLIAGWAAYAILPHFGWRSAMSIGGLLPLLAVVVIIAWIPESLEYLVNRAKRGADQARLILQQMIPEASISAETRLVVESEQSKGATIASLFTRHFWLGTLALWVALATNSVVYYFVLSWMPSILTKIGTTQQDAILASSIANIGGILAAFITGPLMDRYGAYRVLIGHFIVGTLFTIVVGMLLSPDLVILVPAALCLGFCVSGLQKGISALAVRFYTIDLRAVGIGWMFGIARFGAIGGPILASLLFVAGWSPSAVFYLMAIPLLVGTLAVAIMGLVYGPKREGHIDGTVLAPE